MSQSNLPALSRAEEFARAALSEASLRAYRADWAHFLAWCEAAGRQGLPASAETICDYLASMATTHKRSTIQRRLVTIGQAHRFAGEPWARSHPKIRSTLKGMFRLHGQPATKAAALCLDETVQLVGACDGFAGLRDRAMFLVAFAGALRRSEVAAMQVRDLGFEKAGLRLFLPKSKTDQEGEGEILGIPNGSNPDTCPVSALKRWLQAAPTDGAVFRAIRANGEVMDEGLHPDSIGRILQKRAAEAGITAGPRERVSAHGLRAGYITEAYRRGARDEEIMAQSRHSDLRTMHGYIRRAKLLTAEQKVFVGL